MSRNNPKVLYDGFDDCDGGMDSGRSPHLLRANQFALLFNATTRFTRLKPRPGWTRVVLDWDGDAEAQAAFEEGKFQHASVYIPQTGNPMLMAVVSGKIYTNKVLDGGLSKDITLAGDPNSSILPRGWSTQAEMFWIYNDGESRPFIWDGVTAKRAGNNQLKAGTVTTYFLGRVWYAKPGGRGFRAGDIAGFQASPDSDAPGGTQKYAFLDSLLNETENDFLNEGGDFRVPSTTGGITAMVALPSQDTSYGQGPLQVFTPTVTFSVQAPVDRTVWKDLEYPIQTVSVINYGALSQDSTIMVNGDIWLRAVDGLRSFILARRQFGTWGNTSQSREMDRVFEFDQSELLGFSSAVLFDNRIICTASPYDTTRGIAHRGAVALNLDRISSIAEKPFPSYDGVWINRPILKFVKIELPTQERLFVYALDENNKIGIWEITIDGLTDDGQPISWGFETRAFNMRNAYDWKELRGGEVWVSNAQGTVTFRARYKADVAACWNEWHQWQICADTASCDDTSCTGLVPKAPQYRTRMGLPNPDYETDTGDGTPTRNFNELQVRFDIEGQCTVDRFLAGASIIEEQPFAPLVNEDDCKTVECCPEGIFDG